MVSNDNRRHQKERGTDLKGCGESARRWQGDFPGGLVAKTPNSLCRGPSSISGQGTRFHLLQLKRFHTPHLEKEMATHSSILAWKIPWTEEPGSYNPWGYKELDTT